MTNDVVCPTVPKILFEPTKEPAICSRAELNDDMSGCIEGLIGDGEVDPVNTSLGSCNNDKSEIKRILEGASK